MAVSKSFFLKRKGVVGSLQMARMNGQQITKDKASFVRDAKTRSQLIQRMCMATATAFYKEGKDVLSWSVEGARNTNEAMHFLYNKNVAILRNLAQQEKGLFKLKEKDFLVESGSYLSPLFVSYGSLRSVNYQSSAFYLCDHNKWQVEKGDSILVCGWRNPVTGENGRQFAWYKIDFFENPTEDFFENVTIPLARERMNQFSTISFSDNSVIKYGTYIQQASVAGRLRLSVAGLAQRYAVIRIRHDEAKWRFSTSQIVETSTPHTNYGRALKTYGVPRDEILNGE